MAVAHYKIEIAFLEQMVFNSGHDQRRVPFADLRNKHADRIAPLLPQGPGQVIRPVIQLSGRRADQLLRSLRNRSGSRTPVAPPSYRASRQPNMLRQGLHTDT